MQAPRVLVIYDDVAIREAVAEVLDREGYQILLSSDGKQALKTINNSRPDVIVLDLKMPGMDGLEFFQRFDPRLPANCPVIVLTAYADAGTVKACHDAGVGCLLEKPFRLRELREAVRSAVIATESTPHEYDMRIQAVEPSLLEHGSPEKPLGAGASEETFQ